jgi:hypothetical protein
MDDGFLIPCYRYPAGHAQTQFSSYVIISAEIVIFSPMVSNRENDGHPIISKSYLPY